MSSQKGCPEISKEDLSLIARKIWESRFTEGSKFLGSNLNESYIKFYILEISHANNSKSDTSRMSKSLHGNITKFNQQLVK